MTEFAADFEGVCGADCGDLIRLGDLVVDLAGEIFHAECV